MRVQYSDWMICDVKGRDPGCLYVRVRTLNLVATSMPAQRWWRPDRSSASQYIFRIHSSPGIGLLSGSHQRCRRMLCHQIQRHAQAGVPGPSHAIIQSMYSPIRSPLQRRLFARLCCMAGWFGAMSNPVRSTYRQDHLLTRNILEDLSCLALFTPCARVHSQSDRRSL